MEGMSMMVDERQRHILEHLKQHGAAKVADLAALLGVSEMTVHRDLSTLAKRNVLRKVHGGAVARHYTEVPYADRAGQHQSAKTAIALRARSLVRDHMSVYLSPGSTAAEFAVRLQARGLRIFTNSLPTATALARADHKDVTLLGGKVVGFAEALVGEVTEDMLHKQFFHLAFLAVTGVDLEAGLTVFTEQEARVVQAAMRAARKTVLLSDASKFGLVAGPTLGPLYGVHTLVTERIPDDYRRYCEQHDIEVLLAPEEGAS